MVVSLVVRENRSFLSLIHWDDKEVIFISCKRSRFFAYSVLSENDQIMRVTGESDEESVEENDGIKDGTFF